MLGLATASPLCAAGDDHAADAKLGLQVYQQLAGQDSIVKNSPYAPVLNHVGGRIVRAAGPQWYPQRFYIVRSNEIDAFSAPGGYVFINEGLLRSCDNVDELANVIGHETSHLVHGDVSARNATQQRTDVITKVAKYFARGNAAAEKGFDAASGIAHYAFLNFSRQQEYAADQYGAMIAAKAGFNPWGTTWYLKEVERVVGDAGFEQYLQHHPSTTDRIDRVTTYLSGDTAAFGHWSSRLANTAGLPTGA